jgi:hypothetical protein
MSRFLRHLLIVAVLLFGQHAAQLHAFSHLPQDPGGAERGQKGAPPLTHPAAQCLAFHAVDSALPNLAVLPKPPRMAPPPTAYFVLPLPFQPRIQFDSRAPPALS